MLIAVKKQSTIQIKIVCIFNDVGVKISSAAATGGDYGRFEEGRLSRMSAIKSYQSATERRIVREPFS